MYFLINQYCQKIFDNITMEYVKTYDFLIENRGNFDDSYKEVYSNFWNLHGIDSTFRKKYFEKLFEYYQLRSSNIKSLLLELYENPYKGISDEIGFSFATKLIHTINPYLPIYDKRIKVFYSFNDDKDLALHKRINVFLNFYKYLEKEYNRIIRQDLLGISIKAFRKEYHPKYFTDERIIDSLLWGFVQLTRDKELF